MSHTLASPEVYFNKTLDITASCQIILSSDGKIIHHSSNVFEAIGLPHHTSILNYDLITLLEHSHPHWTPLIPPTWAQIQDTIFLPWISTPEEQSSSGMSLQCLSHNHHFYLTFTPTLAPYHQLKRASLNDLHKTPAIIAPLFLRLQQAESRLQNYMENFPGILFCQRPDFSFSYLGPRFESCFGLDPSELSRHGNIILEHIYEGDRTQFLNELKNHAKNPTTFSITYRLRNPRNNTVLYILDVRTPQLSPSGLLLGYEGVWLDITRQAIAEDRLARSAWKENLATLTNGLIHDFSNVMASIFSIAELCISDMDESHPWYKNIHQIKKSTKDAQQLVRRIIDLNRDVSSTANYFNLNTLIKDQLDLIKVLLPKKSIIQCDLCEQELPVYIDDVRFRQTLINLAINAKDACDHIPYITITTSCVKVGDIIFADCHRGPVTIKKSGVLLSFSDNGSGIPSEHLSKIFDPFFTTKEAHKGSGFGLYNAKLFAENSLGLIDVQTQIDMGSCFKIYIPFSDFDENEADPHLQKSQNHSNPHHPNIIICTDGSSQCHNLASSFQEKGFDVTFFSDTKLLIQYLQELKTPPSLVYLFFMEVNSQTEILIKKIKLYQPSVKIALHPQEQFQSSPSYPIIKKFDFLIEPNTLHDTYLSDLSSIS